MLICCSFQSYKKRFFYLKQLADKSFLLEYHKDERSASAKGHVYLDSLIDVIKVRDIKSLKGAWSDFSEWSFLFK